MDIDSLAPDARHRGDGSDPGRDAGLLAAVSGVPPGGGQVRGPGRRDDLDLRRQLRAADRRGGGQAPRRIRGRRAGAGEPEGGLPAEVQEGAAGAQGRPVLPDREQARHRGSRRIDGADPPGAMSGRAPGARAGRGCVAGQVES